MGAFGGLRFVLYGAVAALVAAAVPAAAQSYFCQSLQADYLAMDRAAGSQQGGGGDLRQQLAAAQAAVRRAGCSRFLFFAPRPNKQCPQLLGRVDQLQNALMRTQGGFGFGLFGRQDAARERDRLRTTLLAYGCDVPLGGYGDAYRTVCVRTCDGYYFPISSNGNRARFKVDQAVCQSMYPPGTAELYVYRYPSDDVSEATSLGGVQYGRQPFAFTYRSTFDASCKAQFNGGDPKVVGSTLTAASPAMVAAYTAPLKGKRKRAIPDPEDMPDAAAAEQPPDESVPDDSSMIAIAGPAPDKVRTIGPSYYYRSSYYGSSSGPPPKVAGYKPPVLGDRQVPARELPPNPPVAASILPNPLSPVAGK